MGVVPFCGQVMDILRRRTLFGMCKLQRTGIVLLKQPFTKKKTSFYMIHLTPPVTPTSYPFPPQSMPSIAYITGIANSAYPVHSTSVGVLDAFSLCNPISPSRRYLAHEKPHPSHRCCDLFNQPPRVSRSHTPQKWLALPRPSLPEH